MSVVTRNCGGSGSQHTEGWAQSPTAPLEVLWSARGPDAASQGAPWTVLCKPTASQIPEMFKRQTTWRGSCT